MPKKLEYLEVMWAEQAPDIYDGPNCDEHRPDWTVNELGCGEVDRVAKICANSEPIAFPQAQRLS